ncbi:HupE/UreJ family protein [Limnohabitans sp. Rim8]|uniref:HupE/UreJ family protein n=1 Tax=Limnohabitans sp. Rim8 TaxID=1100718 RepID=UPI0025EFAC99|nr:HupE/UreJ family protein [Limnohabitans sp. Rim8]
MGVVRFIAALWFCAMGAGAHAHLISAGNGLVNVLPERAVLLLAVPVSVFQNVDINQDGLLQPEEIRANRDRIIEQLNQSIRFEIGDAQGEVLDDQIMVSVHADDRQGTPQIEWLRQIKFPQEALSLPVKISLTGRLLNGEYLFQVKRVDGQELAKISASHPSHVFFNQSWGTFQAFFIDGWQHIVEGYDHLVFLVTLLAASVVWRRWFWLLTAFTLAHGITYGLASFGVVQVRSELIEPVIALTILITAALSLFKVQLRLRTEMVAVFGLGLFHGLGFASAMALQLQGQRYPMSSIVGFNLGVEAGQILICLILGGLFEILKRKSQQLENIRNGMIWSGFLAGGFWLFERI